MGLEEMARALERTAAMLRRRPAAGLHVDPSAVATWAGGARVTIARPDGTSIDTDMPPALGGDGTGSTPGWLFRAGVAACTATVVALTAAMEGVALSLLEVEVGSRSDTRAVLGIAEEGGADVAAAPDDFRLHVRIAAADASEARLRTLVATAVRRCPMASALQSPRTLQVVVEVAGS